MKYLSYCLLLVGLLFSGFAQAQDEEYGLASYYSDDFEGRATAYGDIYDKDELTCAHKRYPYGTMLTVTRLDNNKSVRVKVIDKGPFIKGRVVDLSRRAADILGITGLGAVEVKVERAGSVRAAEEPAAVTTAEPTPRSYDEPAPERVAPPRTREVEPEPAPAREPETREPARETPKTPAATPKPRTTQPRAEPAKDRFSPVGKDYTPFGLYRIVLEKPDARTGYGVQVASFTNYDNVMQKVADLQAQWFDNILLSIEPAAGGKGTYKVILGPFDDLKTAQHYQESLGSRYKIRGFVVNLSDLKY